ncbi:unnamed protein product [Pleuronectes platessa]|uniref:EF-hand domain-containing protein n=1 Tax=Pleuronectes platessa TaxID=8262 RepID=A0A9N7VGD2_PLEPL|nr:unnamed protein product [Pleuronectes platessa]
MGNSISSALSKEILEDLKLTTKFTEHEISQWYENFQKQCPTGRITPEEFEQIYIRFFPDSDSKSYARHEYIIALHMTSTGKTIRKLEWAFSLFDVDKNGYINKTEVTEICQAIFKLIPKEEQSKLPEDENTPEKRADKLWAYFEKKDNERLAEGEFIKGVIENENAMRLIHYEPSGMLRWFAGGGRAGLRFSPTSFLTPATCPPPPPPPSIPSHASHLPSLCSSSSSSSSSSSPSNSGLLLYT